MNPDLKDVLLVLLGAAGSLLGTALTLFFELRRDRLAARRERKIKEYETLIAFITNFSRLNNVLYVYFEAPIMRDEEARKTYFKSNVEPLFKLVRESPINGLPVILMTRNKQLAKKLEPVVDRTTEIAGMLETGVKIYEPNFLANQQQKVVELNKLLAEALSDIERELSI